MKKSRKILSGIMALCLMGTIAVIPESIAPVVSMVASADSTYGDFKYVTSTDNTAVKITKYTGLDAEVVIPAEIEGMTVTYIDGGAFQNNTGLASVVIPDSVNTIGWSAFADCTALTSVTLPANLKKLDPYVFKSCKNLTGDIVLPEGLTSMSSGVFWGCSSITSVSLPKYIKTIGENSFNGCTDLESVSFTDDLTAIEAKAFNGCAKLQNITLPETLKTIGAYAFYGCESFTEFIMPDSVQTFGSEALKNCVNIETLKLSENLKELSFEAFKGCKSIKEVTIPEKVEKIGGANPFLDCSSLEKITVLNPEFNFGEFGFLGGTEKTVIYGYAGSTAQTFAEQYKREFVALGEEPTTDVQAGLLGDANTDGKLSVADAVFIMQSLSNPDEFTLNEQQALNADVLDVGGGLTTMDALVIQMIDINIISAEDLPITSEELNKLIK